MKVPVSDIIIKERVRTEIGDISSLMKSMREHGQLNPITITRGNELIAGHRRLLSAQELEWTYIDAAIVDRSTEAEKLQLELEENVHRKDFSPEELLAGYRRLEKLMRPSIGRRVANFFGNIFGKLCFWRKKTKKNESDSTGGAETATQNSSGSENRNAAPNAGTNSPDSKNHSDENDEQVGQYGL